MIAIELKQAFTKGAFAALTKLASVRQTGVFIDVYTNEISLLAGLTGYAGKGLKH